MCDFLFDILLTNNFQVNTTGKHAVYASAGQQFFSSSASGRTPVIDGGV